MNRLAMMAQAISECLREQGRARGEALLEERSHQDGDRRGRRDAEGEQRDQCGVGVGVVGRFRAGDTFDGTLAQLVAVAGELLLGTVGQQGGHGAGHARDEAQAEADAGAAGHGRCAPAPFLAGREQ